MSESRPRRRPRTRSPRGSRTKSPATKPPRRNSRRKSKTWTRSSTTRCESPWVPSASTGRAVRGGRKRRKRVPTPTRTTRTTTTTTTFTIAPTRLKSADEKKKRPRRTNAPPSAGRPPRTAVSRAVPSSRRPWRRPRRCGRRGRLRRRRLRSSRAEPRRRSGAKVKKTPREVYPRTPPPTMTWTRSWTRSAPSATPRRFAGSRCRSSSASRSWRGWSVCCASRIRTASTNPGRRWPNPWPSSRRLSARRWPPPRRLPGVGLPPRLRRRERLRRRRRSASGYARGRSKGTSRLSGNSPADQDRTPGRTRGRSHPPASAPRLPRTRSFRWVYPPRTTGRRAVGNRRGESSRRCRRRR